MRMATGAVLLVVSMLAAPLGMAAETDPVSVAVNDPTRTDADRSRDARDHTTEVLSFFGIAPGMTVVDLFAGGGYYSEVIGRIVGGGSSGKVYMHNNAAYQTFIGDALTQRVNGGRLQHVVKLDAEIGQLGIPPASVDLVLMSMSYHDLYFRADDWAVDPKALFTDVHTMLKPGGTLAIIDHSAIAGTGVGWIADRWGWGGVFGTMVACCLLTMLCSALTLGHRAQSARRLSGATASPGSA